MNRNRWIFGDASLFSGLHHHLAIDQLFFHLLAQLRRISGALTLADQGLFTRHLAAKLAPEWASFPTLAGRSFYGQPVRRFNELRRFYEDNLAELRRLEPVAQVQKASCEPADSLFCRVEALQRLP